MYNIILLNTIGAIIGAIIGNLIGIKIIEIEEKIKENKNFK